MLSRAKEILDQLIQDGESGIKRFIDDREVECLYLDFKRSADNGSGNKIHQNDRVNLAKAISGFGNSEGGVIIWGVDCRPGEDYADVAQTLYPLHDSQKFKSWLEGCISSSTTPPHSKVEHHVIQSEDSKGYVVTHIPKSNNAPHQVITNGKGQHHYYIRAGSDFVPTPHAVLSGMFGRRPQPKIFNMYTMVPPKIKLNDDIFDQIPGIPPTVESDKYIKTTLGIQLFNEGPGIGHDVFMWLRTFHKCGPKCILSIEPMQKNWSSWKSFGVEFTTISDSGFRLPPGVRIQPFVLDLFLMPPFDDSLEIEGQCGSAESPSYNFSFKNSKKSISKIYNKYIRDYEKDTIEKDYDIYNFWNIDGQAS
jgi:Schlafen, AlbA_2